MIKKISQHSLMVLIVLFIILLETHLRINYQIPLLWIIIGAILGPTWMSIHNFLFGKENI